ncbi:hypothetical protein G6O67_005603 [Ophiocordyceps sinensis]|uniref:Uncharacterized protein n=2 Tax=Ophiocordyceps sinensis TaxID=72228 RepID=A0A8H4PMV4_9HYPO|nr:hypothetical protein OCS_04531 [Ophiocordyceps sinensis CO18]KAF4506918.1 hypothetical protein G6O67_005603 [Ophiocordyceps sinensis]
MTSQKTYFEAITDQSTLARASQGQETLASLLQSQGWKSGVSKWGRQELIAHRAVCSRSVDYLPLLKRFKPTSAPNECIAALVNGPGPLQLLLHKAEAQLVQHFHPSLGYVWAAMRPFLEDDTDAADQPSRGRRERRAPERLEGGALSDEADFESSPESGQRPESSASTNSSFQSAGYTEKSTGALLEEDTVQLASFFIRCVLNHTQATGKSEPFLEFRSKRLSYSFTVDMSSKLLFQAIDDGGIQVSDYGRGEVHQVALLEGKRVLQVTKGRADIPDEVLGQMIGEALALKQESPDTNRTPRTDFITILAITHYLRFFNFSIPDDYVASYQALADPNSTQTGLEGVLKITSTDWLDLKDAPHRGVVVSHLRALIRWANEELA